MQAIFAAIGEGNFVCIGVDNFVGIGVSYLLAFPRALGQSFLWAILQEVGIGVGRNWAFSNCVAIFGDN